jgi:hypothetical protein
MLKKLICKIFGHRYEYNFISYPSRCKCKRCGVKWKTAKNPNYIPGESNPLSEDLEIWVEDHSITATYTLHESDKEFKNDREIDFMAENIKKTIDEELAKKLGEFLTNQETLDPEFAKVMDDMLFAKKGNKPTKNRKWKT